MRQQTSTAGTLDLQSLSTLRDTLGSEESFQGILRDFLRSSSRLSRKLEAGLSGGPAKDVLFAAHTLKSMARLLGATTLGDICLQVERLCLATPARIPPTLLQAVLAQLAATRRAVGTLMT